MFLKTFFWKKKHFIELVLVKSFNCIYMWSFSFMNSHAYWNKYKLLFYEKLQSYCKCCTCRNDEHLLNCDLSCRVKYQWVSPHNSYKIFISPFKVPIKCSPFVLMSMSILEMCRISIYFHKSFFIFSLQIQIYP